MNIDKISDIVSNLEMDPLSGIKPKLLLEELITKINNANLLIKYGKLDNRWKLKFEGAFLNLYREFDMKLEENKAYISSLFKLIDRLDAEEIDETAKLLRVLSAIDPISIKTLDILFDNQGNYGIIDIKKLRERHHVDSMGLMTLKNCGLILDFSSGGVIGGGSEDATISHDGYRILKLSKYKTEFPFNIKSLSHKYEYALNKKYNVIKMEKLWKSYLLLYDISLQMKRYKNDDTKIQIDGLKTRTSKKETENKIMQILTNIFERDHLTENALEYLFVFRPENIGLDIIWRSLKLLYESLNQYIYTRDNIPSKNKPIEWEDIKYRLGVNIKKITAMKSTKDEINQFYYQWH